MSYADPQEFCGSRGYPCPLEECTNDDDSTIRKVGQKQTVYTIPGYISYTMSRTDGNCTPQDITVHFKEDIHHSKFILGCNSQADNPAFHHQEPNNKLPPALPPCRDSEITKALNSNCSQNLNKSNGILPSYDSEIYSEATLEKSSCCRTWTLWLTPFVKNRKCIILSVLILAIVLLVAALVVVLYLTVGGGMELFSSSKSDNLQHGITVINGTFRISSVAYDADLADPATKLYNILQVEVSNAVFLLFNKSSISDIYNRTELLGFRNGSVIVDLRVYLSSYLEDAVAKVTSAFVKGLVNMHGTVLLDKFVVDIRSISFKAYEDRTSSTATGTSKTDSLRSADQPSKGPILGSTTAPVPSVDHPVSAVRGSAPSHEQNSKTSVPSSHSLPSLSSSSSGSSLGPILNGARSNSSLVSVGFSRGQGNSSPNRWSVTSPSLSTILSSASSHTLRTSHFNGTYNRPVHPLLRPPPPPPGQLNPSSHRSRPVIPPPLQIDFADSPGWSSWSSWSACGSGLCLENKNYTQMRTRDCRTRNGTGGVLTDNRECLKKGGMRFEIRRCVCHASQQSTRMNIMTTTGHPQFTGRPCNECTEDEICLAKHSETNATCRAPLNKNDQSGCGGWCNETYEYCQLLSSGARRCIDDRMCLPNEWQCGNGLCVPLEKRCDGHFNCYDTTDELNCACDERKNIRCGKNTSCLPLEKRCNNIIDCWDGSDEDNCTKRCVTGEFACKHGQCIPSMYFCDGLIDCQDGSDEPDGCNATTCIGGEFRCANGRCIQQALICDGSDTCGDGSDELVCNATLPPHGSRPLARRSAQRRLNSTSPKGSF